ncbi:MAG TPA: ricin-type beta-trefoil lectin domain protein [Candidatus Saccharimonadia bacterium]
MGHRSLNVLTALAFLLLFSGSGILVYEASQAAGTPEFASGIAGKCLDDYENLSTDGTKADLFTCNGTPAQQWSLNSNGTITIHGACLDVTGAGTTIHVKVEIYHCVSGAPNQQWSYTNHTLVGVQSGMCLDDPSSSTVDGTQLQIYTCNGTSAQSWTLTTYVVSTPTPTPPPPTPTPTPTPVKTPTPTPTPVKTPTPAPVGGGSGGSGGGGSQGGGGSSGGSTSSGGSGGGSQPVVAPATPANFTASVSGSNAVVDLTWQAPASTAAVTYQLERSLDQINWSVLSTGIPATNYEDTTVSFEVHYYYRLMAQNSAGSSPYATADVTTPVFTANTGDPGSNQNITYNSDDNVVTITMPSGAVSSQADCSVSNPTGNETIPSGKRLVVGPYALICKDSSGLAISSFAQPLSWTLNIKSKLKGLVSPVAYTVDDSGHVTLIKSGNYTASVGTISFTSSATDGVLVLASVAPGIPWNAVAIVLIITGIVVALIVLVLRKQQKVNYNDYLRNKYYDL